ncbi:MAG: tetratricopeptide repeat protein [Byssovorax sp.]
MSDPRETPPPEPDLLIAGDAAIPEIAAPEIASPEIASPEIAAAPPPVEPPAPPLPVRLPIWERARAFAVDYVLGRDPTFWAILAPLLVLSLVLFSRWPGTNYIFDEQEALLANPYVNATGGLKFIDAIHRDFWGLPADRSVGSYRPIPDFLWRILWNISKQPFFHHIYNVLFHAVNGAILGMITFAWTKRRGLAYLTAALFVACAVLTEAVSGIVGIADVLGGMGALLALAALSLPAWAMPFGVFTAVVFGLFCKESALVCVPLVPFAALLASPLTHPERPARVARTLLAAVAAAGAFYLYVELRKRWFLSPLPQELTTPPPEDASWAKRAAYDFLVWFHQAPLPKDPLNNPLAEADTPHRIAGALRVYWRGLTQIVFPKTLSGDYSFPQEPVPATLVFPESVLGGLMMIAPPLASVGLWIAAMIAERRARRGREHAHDAGPFREPAQDLGPLSADLEARAQEESLQFRLVGLTLLLVAMIAITADFYIRWDILHVARKLPLGFAAAPVGALGLGLYVEGMRKLRRPEPEVEPVPILRAGLILAGIGATWVVVSYFPHSNIPAVLPTVRAERFWYFPAIGSALVLAVFFAGLHALLRERMPRLVPALCAAFLLFQCGAAYRHATHYRDDLTFWDATKDAVPNSAKAHLNYSVMKGARGDLETRLTESKIALSLAPKWPMAHVYTGDTLCRLHRAGEAWPYYDKGFDIGPNELSLIALGLQCMYDEKDLLPHEKELRALAAAHEGSWIAYLAIDTLQNYEKNKGVDPKYRPRGYNEGPKE